MISSETRRTSLFGEVQLRRLGAEEAAEGKYVWPLLWKKDKAKWF